MKRNYEEGNRNEYRKKKKEGGRRKEGSQFLEWGKAALSARLLAARLI